MMPYITEYGSFLIWSEYGSCEGQVELSAAKKQKCAKNFELKEKRIFSH
jgi:hypothetical protein